MHFDFIAKRAVLFGLMVISLLAGGCVRSTHPVLKDEQVNSNDALLGKWVSKDGKVSAELRPGDNNKYKLSYTNGDGKTGNFLVRFGKIGDVQVAEMSADAFTPDTGDEYKSLLMPLYSMVVIQKTSPDLELTAISVDWLKKYVQAHPDELDVTNPDELIVTASTDDFQAFFTRHLKDAGMLGETSVFVHPGDPMTRPAGAP
jgi:hypothetical protein